MIGQLCLTVSILNVFGCDLCNAHTVFTRISAAALIKFFAPQVRHLIELVIMIFFLNLVNRGLRLFEGGAYLKIGRYTEIFSFSAISSIRRKIMQLVIEASFHCHHSPLSALFSDFFSQSDLLQQPFFKELKDISSAV